MEHLATAATIMGAWLGVSIVTAAGWSIVAGRLRRNHAAATHSVSQPAQARGKLLPRRGPEFVH